MTNTPDSSYLQLKTKPLGVQKGTVVKADITDYPAALLTIDFGSDLPDWYKPLVRELDLLDGSTVHSPLWSHDNDEVSPPVSTWRLRCRVPMNFLKVFVDQKQVEVKSQAALVELVDGQEIRFYVWRPQYNKSSQRVSFTVSSMWIV